VVTLDPITENKPVDYFRFVSAEINGEEVYPVHRNAVSMTKNSPIRGTVKSFYFDGNKIKFLLGGDTEMTESSLVYIRKPDPGKIDMTYSDQGGDYQTPSVERETEWGDNVRNLMEALLLERLGIETRESVVMEASKLGIQREMLNYQ